MSHNDFQENYVFGVKHYRHLLEVFYRHYCYDGRFVSIGDIRKSRLSDVIQRTLKTDTVIQKGGWISYGVEEKVVAWPATDQPYTALFLETDSCTNPNHERPGWMATCQADLLLYAFEIKDVGLLIYLFPFPRLKDWFWHMYLPHLPTPDTGRSVMPDHNRTAGRIVPIATVIRSVPTRCFVVPHEEECREVRPTINVRRLRARFLQRASQPERTDHS